MFWNAYLMKLCKVKFVLEWSACTEELADINHFNIQAKL